MAFTRYVFLILLLIFSSSCRQSEPAAKALSRFLEHTGSWLEKTSSSLASGIGSGLTVYYFTNNEGKKCQIKEQEISEEIRACVPDSNGDCFTQVKLKIKNTPSNDAKCSS